MDLSPAWYDAIAVRTSQRRYTPTPLPDAAAARLRAFGAADGSSPDARLTLIDSDVDHLFTGVFGSYGAVAGAPLAAAFVGREGCEGAVGYLGEAFVLEATTLGLGTCWIAGSFDKQRAGGVLALAPGERVMALTPVGKPVERRPRGERLMRRAMKASGRLPLATIAPGIEAAAGGEAAGGNAAGGASWPVWARTAVAAARLAPSGANRQPWRFRYDGDGLVLTRAAKLYWTAPLDFGIARLHVELGAAREGVSGVWQPLAEPDVARFVAD
jgi:nitroreductase